MGWEIKQKSSEKFQCLGIQQENRKKTNYQILLYFSNSWLMIVKYQNNCLIAIKNKCTYSTDITEIKPLQAFAIFSKYFLVGMLAKLKPHFLFPGNKKSDLQKTFDYNISQKQSCLGWKRSLYSTINPALPSWSLNHVPKCHIHKPSKYHCSDFFLPSLKTKGLCTQQYSTIMNHLVWTMSSNTLSIKCKYWRESSFTLRSLFLLKSWL